MKLSDQAKEMLELVKTLHGGKFKKLALTKRMLLNYKQYGQILMELREAGLVTVDYDAGGTWKLKGGKE